MNKLFKLLIAFLLLSACEPKYDIILKNGFVFDGQSLSETPLDVAIKGDKIVGIGSFSSATSTFDVTGNIISPGFIDAHAHIENIMRIPDAQSSLRQGITTALGGPDGRGPSPMKEYLDSLEGYDIGINTAYLVGHNTVRSRVLGFWNRPPTTKEQAEMEALVKQAMDEGAYGISTGLKYIPGAYSNVDEVIALSKVVSESGGIYTSHLREEGLGLIEGVQEAIVIGREANIPIVLTHHKAIGRPMWGASVKTLAMVDSARALGIDVMMDQYPYTASSTGISVLIPAWAMAGGATEFKKRVDDLATRKKMHEEIVFNIEYDRGGADLNVVQFANVSWQPDLNGKTLKDWAIERELPTDFKTGADLVIEAQLNGGASCIFHAIGEEDVKRIMQHPMAMVASDGRLSQPGEGHPHPRGYGTFPRVLGKYVREENVLDIELALRKMTSMPAERIGLEGRGIIAEGAIADITVFNPDRIIDNGTFQKPHQYPQGINWVFVNGQLAVAMDTITSNRAGRVLRKQ